MLPAPTAVDVAVAVPLLARAFELALPPAKAWASEIAVLPAPTAVDVAVARPLSARAFELASPPAKA